jgi:hypothetical protein
MLVTGKESSTKRLERLLEELIETLAAAAASSKPGPVSPATLAPKPPVVNITTPVRAWSFQVVRDAEGKISKINATPSI